MKKLISLSLVVTLLGILFFASCTKEDLTTPDNPTSTDPRAKFNGHWYVKENSQDFGQSYYYCDITDSTDASHILLAYLYGFNKKAYSTVSGNNLSIPSQIIQGNCISGNGVLANANQINLTYFVQITLTDYDTVTAVLTK